MAVQLPTFADLPSLVPQPSGALPSFSKTDPVAEGEEALGKGLQKAGIAASDWDLSSQLAKDKLEEANATVDLFSRVDPLKARIAKETDPAKVAELQQDARGLTGISGQAISNPLRRQMWMAQHSRTVNELGIQADTRNTVLGREQAVADIHGMADKAIRTAVGSDDPQAMDIAQGAINDSAQYGRQYGAITPDQAYTFTKQRQAQLYVGKADHLIAQGRPDQASALLDAHREDIDSITLERLQLRIAGKANKINTDGAALRALGLPTTGLNVPVGSLPSDSAASRPGMAVGGAIPQRVAAVAASENVDPALALATAHTESRMGQNLGSRGNIFQLGKTEWASVGGGQMGNPDTDIRNGIAFLSKTQQELGDKLGRPPAPWETYLAHQQGVAGATALLSHPDTPAGQLVGDKAVSANGGDPNAPASAFVSKWRGAFNHNLSLYSGGVSGETAAPGNSPVAIGDSIAAHLIRKAGVGGQESGKVGVSNPGDTAVSGYGPTDVLGVIASAPEQNIKGRDIVLSTGVSNNPAQIDQVASQIQTLKARGAASVTILGVGTADKLKGANDQLAQIATQNGATFAGPLAKVASDGIHSSDPKAVLAQARAAAPLAQGQGIADQQIPAPGQIGATTAAQPAQSRTGLPSLTDAYMRILRDPAIKTDEQVRQAFGTATTIHNAMEADAARTERMQTQQQHAALKAREDQIWADAYSPQPKITAQQIAVDPAFSGQPERRKAMIELINNPPGSGVPAAQSYSAALSLIDRIRLPEGNADKITDEGQLYPLMRSMNRADFDYVRKTLNDIRAPGGEALAKEEDRFFKDFGPFIDKSNPLTGTMDPSGKARLYEYHRWVDSKKDELKKAGKNPNDLFDPASPSYVGKPEILNYYQPTLMQSQQSIKDFAAGVPRPLPPLAPWNPPPMPPDMMTAPVRQEGESAEDYLKRTGQQ